MRIQTRLFAGIAVLMLTLMGLQWWLHSRQVRTLERQLGEVAAVVGRGLLAGPLKGSVGQLQIVASGHEDASTATTGGGLQWVTATRDDTFRTMSGDADEDAGSATELRTEIHMVMIPRDGSGSTPEGDGHAGGPTTAHRVELANGSGSDGSHHEMGGGGAVVVPGDCVPSSDDPEQLERILAFDSKGLSQRVELKVVRLADATDRVLIVQSDDGVESRIPIPVASTVDSLAASQRQGFAIGIGLLAVGLVASGVMARRVARPLELLAAGAEAVGQGRFGAQVEVDASGEVGELQRAFNRMSTRLDELEGEREQWRQREHLVQLGELSRGLAHTLRNPLNTLGLVVEELAAEAGGDQQMVPTARAEIRRIDRWLRSFLALGAGDAAASSSIQLGEVVQGAVLEAVQHGARVELEIADEELSVRVVETAVRAALNNLLENAAEATPDGELVTVAIDRVGDMGVVRIMDRGAGLSAEVRERLFSPHITTKTAGSGMGLFLARQLVVDMHHGQLEVIDREGGGTTAVIRLPLDDGRSGGEHVS